MHDVPPPVESSLETPRAGLSTAVRRRGAVPPLPFPQPSPLFIGRQEDLARCLRLLSRSPLLLAYGVPGIGKTEFLYRLVAELRATQRWRPAQPVLVRAQAGQRIEHLVALLGFLSEGRGGGRGGPGPTRGQKGPVAGSLQDELIIVAHRLDRSAHLVVLDDVHHLDPADLAEVASFLARRIGASRLLIASRIELLLAAETPPPTVVRLPALTTAEATELAARLAECQGKMPPDDQIVLARTGGSPRLIQRLLQEGPGAPNDDEDALTQTLQGLPPAARRLLILARVLAGKLPVAGWLVAARSLVADKAELLLLARHHLVEIGKWTVPDLVWNAIASGVSRQELGDAHRLAARLLLRRGQAAPVGKAAAEAALAAVEHQLAAADPEAAWETCQLWAQGFHAADLGSRAQRVLPGLRAALPEQAVELNLWAARLLLGYGQLDQAQARLDEIGQTLGPSAAARRWLLAGQVAQRAGNLSRAEERFRAAQAAATTAPEHTQAGLHLAELAALRGQTAAALNILQALDPPRNSRRAACTHAQILLLSGQPAAAVRVATQAGSADVPAPGRTIPIPRGLPTPLPRADCQATLAVLLALSHSGCGDLAAAWRSVEQVSLLAAQTGTPAVAVVALCQGIVRLVAGELPAARPPLAQAHHIFAAQHDPVPAATAAVALGSAALASGEFDEAARQLAEALRQATRAGCAPLQDLASALRASALLAAGYTETALALSTVVVARPEATTQARVLARYVLCRGYARAGDAARATQELAAASAELDVPDQEILRARHELELAEFAAVHALPQAAIDHAEKARQFFSTRGMQHATARAHLALALALVTRRAATDLALAQEALGVVTELGTRHGYGPLLLTAALIEAALAHHRGDETAAREHLQRGLAENPTAAHGLSAQPLRAALAAPDSDGWSGNAALLARLGLLPSGDSAGLVELRSAAGRLLLTQDAAGTERARFELVIDLDRNEIIVAATGRRVGGRPLMCAILAHLVTTCADGTDAEHLFREVWKGPEYHPLRHRNTIHVALTRLRQLLRELFPEREFIETTTSGWRLTAYSSLCTLRTARG